MPQGSEKKLLVITVEIDTGKVVSVVPTNGAKKEAISKKDFDDLYNSKDGFRYIGSLLFNHSKAGCIYWINGMPVRYC